MIEKYIPSCDAFILQKYKELINHLKTLPRNNDSYGLIHYDAHWWNFFINDKNKITLFDFEECNYNWFINDIAMVFFYNMEPEYAHPNKERLFKHFLYGYSKENKLDLSFLKEIPHFFRLREFALYSECYRQLEIDSNNVWCRNFIKDTKNRIENDIPWIDFDFESLAEYINV